MTREEVKKAIEEGTINQDTIMTRYPRITSHLIAHSYGYFSPRAAANAVLFYLNDRAFWCEWYMHMGSFRKGEDRDQLIKDVGRDTLKAAVSYRHNHKGFMSEYRLARKIIAQEIKGTNDPLITFASWF
jgi:hypothetical protein